MQKFGGIIEEGLNVDHWKGIDRRRSQRLVALALPEPFEKSPTCVDWGWVEPS